MCQYELERTIFFFLTSEDSYDSIWPVQRDKSIVLGVHGFLRREMSAEGAMPESYNLQPIEIGLRPCMFYYLIGHAFLYVFFEDIGITIRTTDTSLKKLPLTYKEKAMKLTWPEVTDIKNPIHTNSRYLCLYCTPRASKSLDLWCLLDRLSNFEKRMQLEARSLDVTWQRQLWGKEVKIFRKCSNSFHEHWADIQNLVLCYISPCFANILSFTKNMREGGLSPYTGCARVDPHALARFCHCSSKERQPTFYTGRDLARTYNSRIQFWNGQVPRTSVTKSFSLIGRRSTG